jgi:hypothetical protein
MKRPRFVAGVGVLTVSVAIAILWGRSAIISDVITFRQEASRFDQFSSHCGRLSWTRTHFGSVEPGIKVFALKWETSFNDPDKRSLNPFKARRLSGGSEELFGVPHLVFSFFGGLCAAFLLIERRKQGEKKRVT